MRARHLEEANAAIRLERDKPHWSEEETCMMDKLDANAIMRGEIGL